MSSQSIGIAVVVAEVILALYGAWLTIQSESKARRLIGLLILLSAMVSTIIWRSGQWVSQSTLL